MSYICCVDISCLVINVSSGLHGLILTKVGEGRGGEGRGGGGGRTRSRHISTISQTPRVFR